MNRASPEIMLHRLNSQGNIAGNGGGTDVSVLERQQARMKWQQQSFINGDHLQLHNMFSSMAPAQQFPGLTRNLSGLDELMNHAMKPDPGMENGWPDFGGFGDNSGYGYGYGDHMSQNTLLRMTSCPSTLADQIVLQGNSTSVSLSPKKRKDKSQSPKDVSEEQMKEKRIKVCDEEEDSKITHQNGSNCENKNNKKTNSRETSTDNSSKEKSKLSEVQKPDYIHVRARRGQATDSHSLAERVRREKISERMKYLQDLVPGCNKITGKAGMLDEIINYVQSLQRQVEFLSMKLASVNPRLDFNIDNLFNKELFSDFPAMGCSSEMGNPAYFQLNSLDEVVSCCGLEMGINPMEMALRRSISAPTSIPETFIDSSCYNQIQPTATWDADLQNLFRMEFQSQQFTGSNEGSNLKMEI